MMKAANNISSSDTAARDERPVVCHVIHALGVGGAEVLVDQMVRRMADSYRCVVAVLDEIGEIGQRLLADGFTVEKLGRVPGIDRRCARRLQEFADRHGAAFFHAHQYTPFFQAMLSRGLTGQRPVVFTEHGRHYPDLPSSKRTMANRLMLRKQDRLFGCGRAVQQALIQNEGLPEHRVEVIYNGVDLDQLNHPAPDARERIRREFGLSESDAVIVQVARLHELKDHRTAVRTMSRLRNQKLPARLLIVGDGEARSDVELAICEYQLDNFVTLTGVRSDIADLLAASDVFLLTSVSEGIPLTVIEAMAAGLPVVSTSVGGLPEMVTHGETGYLAPSNDDAGLADGLKTLICDPGLRSRMGKAGCEAARATFGLDRMLNEYRKVYDSVLAGQEKRTRTERKAPVMEAINS